MKHVLKIACIALFLTVCTSAYAAPAGQEGVYLKNGELSVVAKDGTSKKMEKEMVATDGTRVTTDGTIITKSGTTVMMRDGQMVTTAGKTLELKDGHFVPVSPEAGLIRKDAEGDLSHEDSDEDSSHKDSDGHVNHKK